MKASVFFQVKNEKDCWLPVTEQKQYTDKKKKKKKKQASLSSLLKKIKKNGGGGGGGGGDVLPSIHILPKLFLFFLQGTCS